MRETNNAFKAEKNKLQNAPIFLYTVFDFDGAGTNLRFVGRDENVVYDGQTYLKFPIRHDSVGENTNSEINQVKLTVSNVSREIQAYLEAYDFRGKRVSVKQVWANQLADSACFLEDFFYIDNYSADINAVEFVCTSKFDVLQVQVPARKYFRNYCQWKFKSAQCAYAGAESVCNKTLARCEELGNKTRFGGFPSIPSHRIFIG